MIHCDDVCDEQPTSQTKMFGLFTQRELNEMRDEFLETSNTHRVVRKLLTPIFQSKGIRSFDTLRLAEDEYCVNAAEDIQTMFYNLQTFVLVERKKETSKVLKHKKGEFVHNEDGSIQVDANGQPRQYRENIYEEETKEVDVMLYPPKTQYSKLDPMISEVVVPPNFDELRKRLLDPSKISYERGCEIIRELTNYYIFEDRDKFVDRFSLLICNAKAKGLGIHPKYPVLFSLVGDYNKGKGWFSTMIRKTYDKVFNTFSQKSSFKRLLKDNRFNGVMMTRGFIALDEKNGADSSECEELKTLISERDVSVQMKYKEERTVQNLVTFLSTTNERIRGIMGLQKDRRILEFVLKDKKGEIEEETMEKLLSELWEVMPCEHPNPERIVEELLSESEVVVDATMEQIVADLFLKHKVAPLPQLKFDFCRGDLWIKVPAFKNDIKELKYGRHEAIWDWMEKNKLIKGYNNGTWKLNNEELTKFLTKMCYEEFGPLMDDAKGD